MSFSPLLSKRISQTQISQILLFVKAPSFFSSARWYIFILVPWVLNLKRSHRDFLKFLPPHPIPSWGVLKPDVLIAKPPSLPNFWQCSIALSCCKFIFSYSRGLFWFIPQVYLVQWWFSSGNWMSPCYLLIDTCSPNPSQTNCVESYIFRLLRTT